LDECRLSFTWNDVRSSLLNKVLLFISGCALKLFISYRREDTDDFAGRLHDYLVKEFGTDNIFKDVDSIRTGDNWKVTLEQSVAQCDVVVTLIGEQWVKCTDKNGKTRIKCDDDWVRFELEAALRNNRIVLPVLVKGTKPLRNEDLPESLHWLTDIHATEVRGGSQFKDDVARFISELRLRRERFAEQKKAIPVPFGQPMGGGPEGAPGTMVCPMCRRTCIRSDKFCDGCGTSLWALCPKCVAPVLTGQRFCKTCGADVVLFFQATERREELYRRFTSLTALTDAVQQLSEAEAAIRDVNSAYVTFPFFTPLIDLRQQITSTIGETIKAAAGKAYLAKNFSRALLLYQRLDEFGCTTVEGTTRIAEIQTVRRTCEEKATELFNKGDIRKAHATLVELLVNFPDDPWISNKIKGHTDILDRVKQLTETGIRGLLNQHRLMQLDREITWLQSTRMNIQKLPDIATTVRKKLAEANNAIAQAQAEMTSGNVRAAQNIARDILASVADHEEANALVRQSGEIVDKVAELQELVRQQQWCAARELERDIETDKINDPRLPKLAASIKSGISLVDNQIILLVTVIVLMLLAAFFGIPWLTSSIMSFPPLPTGYYLAATAAILVLVFIMWTVFRSKSQTIQRMLMLFRRRRSKAYSRNSSTDQLIQPLVITPGSLSSSTASSQSLPINLESSKQQPIIATSVATTTTAPIMARLATPLNRPESLSATELDQRLECTCIAVEWLSIGLLASLIGYVAATKVGTLVTTLWLQVPLFFLLQITPLYLAFLILNRATRWQWPLGAIVLSFLILLLISYLSTNPTLFSVANTLCIWIITGLMSAYLLRCRLWTGIAAATIGPLLAILLASPFSLGLLFGVNFVVPIKEDTIWGNLIYALLPAAMIWTLLSVVMSSSSGTLIRFVAAENLVVRGIFAIALAIIVSCIAYCCVAFLSTILSEKTLRITAWLGLFAVSQFTTALIRGQWSKSTSLTSAAVSFVLFFFLALVEKVSPGAIFIVFLWCISATSVILLRTRTVDAFRHGVEFLARLRSRIKGYRLPFRVEVRRVQ
jgi:TIR domain/Double zinc ribbon